MYTCPQCASTMELLAPNSDQTLRVCPQCGLMQWEEPDGRTKVRCGQEVRESDIPPELRTNDLAMELQRIYDSEINIRIGWLWDGGVEVSLGDEIGGFEAAENVSSVAEVLPWLQEAIAHFYPESAYTRRLPAELRERAKGRAFMPPVASARVVCPHCGAPNAAPPGMVELIAFICKRCGQSVTVPRKVN